jgi:hypothetical protein
MIRMSQLASIVREIIDSAPQVQMTAGHGSLLGLDGSKSTARLSFPSEPAPKPGQDSRLPQRTKVNAARRGYSSPR